ncbi:HIT-like domain-containing protein [Pavlovales sp. CCMP2436]|nr:HIT-like domain-containing protein [Pavlovales sp. CCMP2436]
MTAKTGDEFALRCDEKVGLYGADQWMLFTTEAGGAPDAASAPLRDSVEARSPSPKRMKAAAGSARESDQPIPSSGATRPEASAYSTRALLTRAYAPPPKPPKPEGLNALARLVRDPAWALQSGKALHVDEKVVVAYDLYAKARLHLLLMPLHPSLKAVHAPTDLRSEHLPAIRELRKCAAWLERSLRTSGALPSLQLRIGFHRVPSMAHLHLHFLTTDHDSEALRTKRHWNSFQPPFFLPIDECIRTLETSGVGDVLRGAQLDGVEAALKADMSCPLCEAAGGAPVRITNIPALKLHLGSVRHISTVQFCSD